MDDSSNINAGIYTGKPPVSTDEPTVIPTLTRTIASLRLNVKAAEEGRIWELLPEGFRDSGATYPLPSHRKDLQKLVCIPVPTDAVHNSAAKYLNRAITAFKLKEVRRTSRANHAAMAEEKINALKEKVFTQAREMRKEAREAVEQVREEANRAIASLNDLFALGREGMGGIMKAHLAGEEWKGEKVSTDQFMGCFRMVSQTVKSMGLPSDQRDRAREAVMEEVAKSVEATRAAISGATDKESEH